MPVLPYRLRVILQTIFRRSRIFRRRQRQQRSPTPPTPVIDKHVTQFITEYLESVTEDTPVKSIQRVHAALIQVNKEYIAREQAKIDNLHRIIREAQDIQPIPRGVLSI